MSFFSKLFSSVSEPSYNYMDYLNDYQGDYAKAVFLWAIGRPHPLGELNDYSRYFVTELGIENPPVYHKQMIDEGYLQKSDKIKNGKETYELSDMGKKFVEEHNDYIKLHQYSRWNISWQEFDEKFHHNFYDTCWGIFNERLVNPGGCDSSRSIHFCQYEMLVDEGKREYALQYLLLVMIEDANDKYPCVAGGLVERLKKYDDIYKDAYIEHLYNESIYRRMSKENFIKLIHYLLKNEYDGEKVDKYLKRLYI